MLTGSPGTGRGGGRGGGKVTRVKGRNFYAFFLSCSSSKILGLPREGLCPKPYIKFFLGQRASKCRQERGSDRRGGGILDRTGERPGTQRLSQGVSM